MCQQLYSGYVRDGNLYLKNKTAEDTLFMTGPQTNFSCYSGTSEFESFPARQIFVSRHGILPSEWDSGYFNEDYIHNYVSKKLGNVLATLYSIDKKVNTCLLYLGGKQHIYVYLYVRNRYQVSVGAEEKKYAVAMLFAKKDKQVDRMIDEFTSNFMKEDDENAGSLNILVKTPNGLSLEKKTIQCPEIDFNLNYNADFEPIDKLIQDRLSTDNSKGLILLHGKPGTGKTTYIRYLINKLKKKVIYIPPNMVNYLADPELIKFFISHSNSVLIVEDAENILSKRASNSSQAVANILNLTDGLLSDCANIQVVATFNMEISGIDNALLRKGRLIAKYEFKELEPDRLQKIADKLGVPAEGAHTLADIYNSSDISFDEKKKKIGF
jgi:hypothetical protein